ncbi:unnamed protein product [Leptosia nina]|uniref:Ubiquinone biosynthesis protein n=1 Tax=Leptosia nina TaxID=320188 RepID=A0AAV1K735_9NEOP
MEKKMDVVELISTLLDNGKYKEVLRIPNEEKFADAFKDNCWDLISVAVNKIQNDTITLKPSLYGVCEELLTLIIEKASPEEALLEFIEQIEVAKNDAQFSIILNPLQVLLKKLTLKRGRSLEWCLNSISTYIEAILLPEHHLEGKERLLMDSDTNVRRIIHVYSLLPPFYQPFIDEIKNNSPKKTADILCAFLISLFGKPFTHIDLDPEGNYNGQFRQCCAIILNDTCSLLKNVLKLITYLEKFYKESKRPQPKNNEEGRNNDDQYPLDHKEKVNMTTLSGLFYAIFSEDFQVPDLAVPQVYSPYYIAHSILISVVHLFQFVEYGPQKKALSLCTHTLEYFPSNLPYTLLTVPIHIELCKSLMNVAIYSYYENNRKNSVKLIETHIKKFEYKGRVKLLKYIFDNANHSGMIGYAITLCKNTLDEAFKDPELPECFTGPQFLTLVKKICYLPHGEESDLVELADQIISALNFLRYVVIKDNDNRTGVKECFSTIETEYLDKLRTGLNMSKAHYEMKLKEINEKKKALHKDTDIQLNIGGNVLDKIPKKNKKEIINSALNAFHLIEGLLGRLSECITINKAQALRNGHRCIKPAVLAPISRTILRQYCKTAEKKDKVIPVIRTGTEENQYEDDIKNQILAKSLDFVPKSGWSVESLASGAEAAGYPGITHGLFPNGGGDLVHYFNVKCNEQLVEQMKAWPKEDVLGTKIPVQKVENAIMIRLLMIEPYKSSWPKAMAIQALPNNVPNCLATLLSLVDDICYHTGDRSVDFNWYIRRVGLAGIYKASELFYLTDSSESNSATRNFVKSRIRDAELIQTALNMNPVAVAPQSLTAAFVTAKNMLGINTLK